jgi:hypothetical protein
VNTSADESREAGKTIVATLTALRYGDADIATEVLEESAQLKMVALGLASMVHGMLTKMAQITGDPDAIDRRLREMALEVERSGLPE